MEAKCINSALWAAYGDALGFITELADPALVQKRYGSAKVFELRPWVKKVGGRMGGDANLPVGCYSDDTQLRLSTSRAISDNGYFDVESFAKIELPVWMSYALGAGRGTKEAAVNLIRRDVNWFSNFFNRKDLNYFDGGGNGAAMRIQPHIWSGIHRNSEDEIIIDVLQNSIATHGHPRGFLGAVFHAKCLYLSLRENKVPNPSDWFRIISDLVKVPVYFHRNLELKSFWLPAWEREKGQSIELAVDEIQGELNFLCELASDILFMENESIEQRYNKIVQKLGGFDPGTRGSGTVCAVISSALAWLCKDKSPHEAMVLAANTLQSDTDSIATMCGAILGGVNENKPPEFVMDYSYIEKEVTRILQFTGSGSRETFIYPDVSGWRAPKTQSEALVSVGGRLTLLGLGYVEPISEPIYGAGKSPQIWQWFKLEFGQTVLLKRAAIVPELSKENDMFNLDVNTRDKNMNTLNKSEYKSSVIKNKRDLDFGSNEYSYSKELSQKIDINELSSVAIKSGFDESIIGSHILLLIDKLESIEMAVAYSAIIAKARISRNNSTKR